MNNGPDWMKEQARSRELEEARWRANAERPDVLGFSLPSSDDPDEIRRKGIRVMIIGAAILAIGGACGIALYAMIESTHGRSQVPTLVGAVALLCAVLGPILFFAGLAQVISKKDIYAALTKPMI